MLLFTTVKTPEEVLKFQKKDLLVLEQWAEQVQWKMVFYVGKCQIVVFKGRRSSINAPTYILYNNPTSVVSSFEYLGVDNDVDAVTSKVYQPLSLIEKVVFDAPKRFDGWPALYFVVCWMSMP